MKSKAYLSDKKMSREEKNELHQQYAATKNEVIIGRLVVAYENLVHKVTHQVSHKCKESYQELFQLGNIGLLKSLRRFDPAKGIAFSSFAVPYIRGEMLHYLRDYGTSIRVPRRWHEIYSQLKVLEKKQATISHQLQAQSLGITSDELSQVKQACKVTRNPMKDLPLHIADHASNFHELNYELINTIEQQVARSLNAQLSFREQEIVSQIFIKLCPLDAVAKKHRLSHRQMVTEVNQILQILASDSKLVAAS